jgi:hypothetical protein
MATGCAGAIPWYLAYRASATPTVPLWPVFAFAAVGLVGVYLLVAALAGLPPATVGIESAHADSLQAIAHRVDVLSQGVDESPFATERERLEFAAHHRRALPFVDDVLRAVEAERDVWQRLADLVRSSAIERFPGPFWNPGSIAARASARLQGHGHAVVLQDGEIAITGPIPIQGGAPPGTVVRDLVWSGEVVWWPTAASSGANATDDQLDAQIGEVVAWFGELQAMRVARDYRDAVLTTRAYRERLSGAVQRSAAEPRARWRCPRCREARRR